MSKTSEMADYSTGPFEANNCEYKENVDKRNPREHGLLCNLSSRVCPFFGPRCGQFISGDFASARSSLMLSPLYL